MADLSKALAVVLQHEGGYSKDVNDPGGETMWGITLDEACKMGYLGSMRDLPLKLAEDRYRAAYWNVMWGDKISDQDIATKLLDAGVNIGITLEIKHLQRVLNVLSVNGTKWSTVGVDGVFGQQTLEALECACMKPGVKQAILYGLRGLQVGRYVELCEANGRLQDFSLGWITRGGET